MISDFFVSLWGQLVSWALSLWPAWSLPDWMRSPVPDVTGFLQNGASMGVWFNWPLLVSVVGAVVVAYGINLTVRGLRWVLGLIPTMGGGS